MFLSRYSLNGQAASSRISYSRLILTGIAACLLQACGTTNHPEKPSPERVAEINIVPTIHFYHSQGLSKPGCSIIMSKGMHRFADNTCTNDQYYYFVITNPREGLKFGIYNAGHCNSDESYSRYYVVSPAIDPGGYPLPIPKTDALAVDIASGKPNDTQVSPGLKVWGYKGGQLKGKVSCVYVEENQ